jgi:hypothetical protein
LSSEKEEQYLEAAQTVFTQDPEIVIFVYGHTHFPSLRQVGSRVVINTGTWLKRLDDVRTRFGFLPNIYVPFFCLNYFHQHTEGEITIDYRQSIKPAEDLTLLRAVPDF